MKDLIIIKLVGGLNDGAHIGLEPGKRWAEIELDELVDGVVRVREYYLVDEVKGEGHFVREERTVSEANT